MIDLINILPKKYDTYDCFQNNIIGPISEYWNVCHLPTLWAGLDFTIADNQPRTFDEIWIFGYNKSRINLLQDFCGLSLQDYRCNGFNEFIKIVIEELEKGIPIAVTIDSYHLPWNEYYQKVSRSHCLLICGIDKKNNEFFCCDGYFNTDSMCKIDMQYLFNKHEIIMRFSRTKVNRKNLKESLVCLINVILNNNLKKSEDMKVFADCLLRCWDAGDISTMSTEISISNFLFYLTQVCYNRHNFVKGLQYFYQEFQSELFILIVSDLSDVCSSWDTFKGLYIKAILSGKKSFIERAINLLSPIEEKEREFTQKLLLCCEKKISEI